MNHWKKNQIDGLKADLVLQYKDKKLNIFIKIFSHKSVTMILDINDNCLLFVCRGFLTFSNYLETYQVIQL